MWMLYLKVMDLIHNGFTHHREITDWANAAGRAQQTLGRANPGLRTCFRKWIETLSCLPIRICRDAPTAEALRFSMFDALTGLSRNPGRKDDETGNIGWHKTERTTSWPLILARASTHPRG